MTRTPAHPRQVWVAHFDGSVDIWVAADLPPAALRAAHVRRSAWRLADAGPDTPGNAHLTAHRRPPSPRPPARPVAAALADAAGGGDGEGGGAGGQRCSVC